MHFELAHTAHAAAIAHLELALAALDTLPTDEWSIDPRKAIQDIKKAIVAYTPQIVKDKVTKTVEALKPVAHAFIKDNEKGLAVAYRKLPKNVQKVWENSRAGKAMAAAGTAATKEHETAGIEHTTIDESFAKEAAAKEAKEAAAKEAQEAAATRTPGVKTFHKFQLADSQTYLV